MRRNSLTGLLACAVALPGIAGQPPATTAGPMEEVMTMRVEGSLAVDAIGNVIAHQVDTKLDPKLQGLVEVAIATWSFMPPTVDGKPATAKSDMRITLAGRKIGEGYEVKVDNVVFFDRKREELTPAALEEKRAALGITSLNFVQMNPRPKYPGFHVNGIVMISVLARPDGTVERAFASHCSLYLARGSKADLSRACKAMQDNGVSAVRHWKVSVDLNGNAPTPGNLTGVLPLFYKMRGDGKDVTISSEPGNWRPEWRDAYREAPWLENDVLKQRVTASDSTQMEMMPATSRLQWRSGAPERAL
jgi:hypothetical protein